MLSVSRNDDEDEDGDDRSIHEGVCGSFAVGASLRALRVIWNPPVNAVRSTSTVLFLSAGDMILAGILSRAQLALFLSVAMRCRSMGRSCVEPPRPLRSRVCPVGRPGRRCLRRRPRREI